MDGGEQMKIVCFALLCILLSGCGNAKTAAEEPKMRFENLDPAKVNMQYGGQKEWDQFYPLSARRLRPLRWEMNCVRYLLDSGF